VGSSVCVDQENSLEDWRVDDWWLTLVGWLKLIGVAILQAIPTSSHLRFYKQAKRGFLKIWRSEGNPAMKRPATEKK